MVPLGLTFHSQLNESVGPVLDRLQHLDPTRDKALFERIQSFGFEHPPADPHVAMQERVMDRATKIVAAQVSETKAPAIELGSLPCYRICLSVVADDSLLAGRATRGEEVGG